MPLSDSNCKLLESNLAEIFEFVSKVSKLLFHTKIESPYAKTLKENKEKIKTKDSNFLKNIKDTS